MPKPTSRCLQRLMAELKALHEDPPPNFTAAPDPNDILKWCFVFDGAAETPYEGGRYVGQLIFDPDFPMKAPRIIFLTPNGRFSTNTAICLSNTSFHPEQWSPIWSIRTIITGLVAFLNVEEPGLGAIRDSDSHRKQLAAKSKGYNIKHLRHIYHTALPELFEREESEILSEEQRNSISSGPNALAGESGRKGGGGTVQSSRDDSYMQIIIGSFMLILLAITLYYW